MAHMSQRRTSTRAGAAAAVLAMLAVLAACSGSEDEGGERTCSEGQALVTMPYVGTSLGAKQLALTFDDGPASRTAELSAYLASQGIHAGFFVNGKNVAGVPGVLAQVVADGHVIGNHTQDHLDLTDRGVFPNGAAGDVKLVTELAATDAIIAPFVPSGRFMFRAPYGAFDARDYGVLQASAMKKYVGHVGWDVGGTRTATSGADWACWQNNPLLSTKACGDLYLSEVQRVGRGIVLMHDADYGNPGNHSVASGLGNTVDMVKYVVPILKARGYTFVRVDHVPAIASMLPPLAVQAADAGADGAADAGADARAPDASTKPDASPPATGTSSMPASEPPSTAPAVQPPANPCASSAAPPRAPDAH